MKTFKFEIGKVGRKAVTMDALTLVDSRLLACANSGGGKSYLLRLLIECVGAKIPTIVLDPEGEFSTLREKLDRPSSEGKPVHLSESTKKEPRHEQTNLHRHRPRNHRQGHQAGPQR